MGKANKMVESVFGAAEEEQQEADKSRSAAGDIATVVMMEAARFDQDLSHKAGIYLDKQSALLELEIFHFAGARLLRVEALKRKRTFDQVHMIFQAFLMMAAALAGVAAVMMVWDAAKSRSVVIDSFDAPPSLVASGLNGKVVAAGLLDVLSHIQAVNSSSAEHRSLSNAWTNDIAIEVPETGLSIGQIKRLLKAHLGHDQHIDGNVVLTDIGGLELTVRGTGILSKTFTGEKNSLHQILVDAGEYIYGQSQPGLYVSYLSDNGREDEAIRFSQLMYPVVEISEKPYVLNAWANSIASKGGRGVWQEALPMYQETIRIKPDYWVGYSNVMNALTNMGDEEGTVRMNEQMKLMAGGRPGRAPELYFQNYDQQVWDVSASRAESIADMESHGGLGTSTIANGPINLSIAQYEVFLHDIKSAKLRVKTTAIDDKSATDVAVAATVKALIAEEAGDLKTASKEWDTFATAYANPTVSSSSPMFMCFAAPTYQKSGQPAKADAALDAPNKATGNATFIDCYRFKADVLDLRGDWIGAKAWYAKAVNLGPSIPSGYYSFGMALVRHGELNEAIAQFKMANLKGPHWADPLKAWGDVLMTQGHSAEALDKYDSALKYAPNWPKLKASRAVLMKEKN